jgi:hypothetical protein
MPECAARYIAAACAIKSCLLDAALKTKNGQDEHDFSGLTK